MGSTDNLVVGTCRGEMSEQLSKRRGVRTGYLDCPGVVPEHPTKNLYLPQLLHVAHWVRKQECVNIEMDSWGDDQHVLAQYQAVGFEGSIDKTSIDGKGTNTHFALRLRQIKRSDTR